MKSRKKKAQKRQEWSEPEDEEELILLESSDSAPEIDFYNDCVGCGDNYFKTDLQEDWIRCKICNRWAHENCTDYDDKCHPCGNKLKIEARRRKGMGKKTKTQPQS